MAPGGLGAIVDYIHQGPWYKTRGILVLNIFLLVPLLTSVINGLDSSLVNGLQISPDWQDYFGNPRGKTLGLLNSAQFLGNLVGLPFSPYVSDTYGRRVALFLGSMIMCAGVGLQAAAWSIAAFIGARFIIGFGLSFCTNAAPLLLIELAYPTHRGRITAMFNSCWYLGSIISAWVCFGAFDHANGSQWSWRVPTLAQALGPLIQIFSIWAMPESPRWLVSKGMESKAAAVLARYHAPTNDVYDQLVVFEMAQIRHAIRIEEEISKSTSYWSLFSSPGNRKRMRIILGIAVFSQWSGNGLVSYYINLILEGVGIMKTETKSIVNGCLQVFNFGAAMGAAMLVDYAGRRPLFLISTSGMLITFCIWTVTNALYNTVGDVNAAKATIPLIFVFFFFYDLAYTPMLVAYTLEILPFKVRAKGFAIMNLAMMAAIAFNQFVNPWALSAISWWYYVVYCGWLVFELVFIFFFAVETKGRTLEETAALFDGEERPNDLAVMGDAAANPTGNRRHSIIVIHPQGQDSYRERQTKVEEQYEMNRRYLDSDTSSISSKDVLRKASG
ncbi:Lactose permease [Psilocybe cubensis]|uniref:Major facilitator superfamily (MFS) profile domain-containing protein n=2 Tax=Psilocybe cubensis TaxID=181762 RepID=A0A8H7XZU5_PSICU|nr:Lactose permease [Psilocybe cubensis]KAH9481375.1 Lactose permease [Psilocybe cubensis]